MAAPTYIGNGGISATLNSLTCTPSYPAGIAAGDIAFLLVGSDNSGAIFTPSGWTQIGGQINVTTVYGAALYWRRLLGTESGSFVVSRLTAGTNNFFGGVVAVYRGATGVNPPYQGANTTSGTATTMTGIAVVTGGLDRLALQLWAQGDDNISANSSGAYTENFELLSPVGNDGGLIGDSQAVAASSTVGVTTRALGVSSPWATFGLALIPVSATVTGTAAIEPVNAVYQSGVYVADVHQGTVKLQAAGSHDIVGVIFATMQEIAPAGALAAAGVHGVIGSMARTASPGTLLGLSIGAVSGTAVVEMASEVYQTGVYVADTYRAGISLAAAGTADATPPNAVDGIALIAPTHGILAASLQAGFQGTGAVTVGNGGTVYRVGVYDPDVYINADFLVASGTADVPPPIVTGSANILPTHGTLVAAAVHGATASGFTSASAGLAVLAGVHGVRGTGATTASAATAAANAFLVALIDPIDVLADPGVLAAEGYLLPQGTAAIASTAGLLAATGVVVVTCTVAATASAGALAAAGYLLPVATAALAPTAGVLAATGNHGVAGTAARAATAGTLTASGFLLPVATAALAPTAGTLAAAGSHDIIGTALRAAAAGTLAATATHGVAGTGVAAATPGTLFAFGSVGAVLDGASFITGGHAILAASGFLLPVASGVVLATGATVAASGVQGAVASIARTASPGQLTGLAVHGVVGTMARTATGGALVGLGSTGNSFDATAAVTQSQGGDVYQTGVHVADVFAYAYRLSAAGFLLPQATAAIVPTAGTLAAVAYLLPQATAAVAAAPGTLAASVSHAVAATVAVTAGAAVPDADGFLLPVAQVTVTTEHYIFFAQLSFDNICSVTVTASGGVLAAAAQLSTKGTATASAGSGINAATATHGVAGTGVATATHGTLFAFGSIGAQPDGEADLFATAGILAAEGYLLPIASSDLVAGPGLFDGGELEHGVDGVSHVDPRAGILAAQATHDITGTIAATAGAGSTTGDFLHGLVIELIAATASAGRADGLLFLGDYPELAVAVVGGSGFLEAIGLGLVDGAGAIVVDRALLDVQVQHGAIASAVVDALAGRLAVTVYQGEPAHGPPIPLRGELSSTAPYLRGEL